MTSLPPHFSSVRSNGLRFIFRAPSGMFRVELSVFVPISDAGGAPDFRLYQPLCWLMTLLYLGCFYVQRATD